MHFMWSESTLVPGMRGRRLSIWAIPPHCLLFLICLSFVHFHLWRNMERFYFLNWEWKYNIDMGYRFNKISPIWSPQDGHCYHPPKPPRVITSRPYEFMSTSISLHAHLHTYLVIWYPLTSSCTIIEYVMLTHGLIKKQHCIYARIKCHIAEFY